jgi:aspartate aminotransferase
MTGWRVGYAAGPLPIIQKMTRLKSHTTSGVCTISQMGAIKALEEGKDLYKEMCNTLRRRRQILLERMERIKCLKFIPPSGAFYLFVDASSLVPKYFEDSRSLCKKILEKVLVATVPGQDFGADGYIRLSFAVEEEKLKEALKRLEDFFLCIE